MALTEQITFDGVATYDDLGLYILDEPKFTLPEPKLSIIDIPGGDGSVDISEVSGDVRYSDREFDFELLLQGRDAQAITEEVTAIMRRLHGRRAPFSLSWDAGYTYHGRAEVTAVQNHHSHGTVALRIVADPYKYAGAQTWRVMAAGGAVLTIPCGRRRWSPVFDAARPALVSHDGRSWQIPAGASTISELWLEPGDNVVIINTEPDYGLVEWSDLSGTWADVADAYTYWFAVAAGGSPRLVPVEWSDLSGTWAPNGARRWIELVYPEDADESYAVFVQVEIYDL